MKELSPVPVARPICERSVVSVTQHGLFSRQKYFQCPNPDLFSSEVFGLMLYLVDEFGNATDEYGNLLPDFEDSVATTRERKKGNTGQQIPGWALTATNTMFLTRMLTLDGFPRLLCGFFDAGIATGIPTGFLTRELFVLLTQRKNSSADMLDTDSASGRADVRRSM